MVLFDQAASRKLEAVYLTSDVIEQRAEAVRALGLRPGDHVLDVGAGPGLLAADMSTVVGTSGRVVGVDVSEAMLHLGRSRRCGAFFAKSDAERLPFASDSFDAVTSTQVLEYVPNVDAALLELRRVLRPGGRVLIIDTDWDSVVWHANDDDRMRRMLAAWIGRFADPHLPRTMVARLRSAGFDVQPVEVLVLLNTEHDSNTYSIANGEIMADYAVSRGHMSRSEVDAWVEDLVALGRSGRYFFSLNRYLFRANKV